MKRPFAAYQGAEPYVFVCYAHDDTEKVYPEIQRLHEGGVRIWYDEGISPGMRWSDELARALSNASLVLFFCTPQSVKSKHCQDEVNFALDEDRPLLVIQDGPVDLPPGLRLRLGAHQSILKHDLTAEQFADKLTSAIRRHVTTGTAMPDADRVRASAPVARPIEPLLAVLAFDNLSSDPDMAYFSDGVSEEIQQTLARGSSLKIIGRASSFQFRGAAKAASNVAMELKATHVLDGSVRRSGNKVRIATQLIECASQTTLWSNRFDRELSDIFTLQDEIAEAVASSLKTAFSPVAELETIDPAVFELFLRARDLSFRPSRASDCIELLERVVGLAPKFARGWAELAHARALLLSISGRSPGYEALRAGVVDAAETALRFDPRLGSAYAALSTLKPFGAYREREALVERALSMAPGDPQCLTAMGSFYDDVGRLQEALTCLRSAYQLNPLFAPASQLYMATLGYVGDYAEYARLGDTLRKRWPDRISLTLSPLVLAAHYGDWTRFDAMLKYAEEAGFMADRGVRGFIRFGQAIRGDDDALTSRVRQLINDQLARTGTVQLQNLVTATRLGLKEEVFSAIEKASFAHVFEESGPLPAAAGYAPGLIFDTGMSRRMMDDIRFVGLCDKLGLCDYWVQADRWPDCAVAVMPYYDFKSEARRLVKATSSSAAPERRS